jgi:restriction endonuclease S subunit
MVVQSQFIEKIGDSRSNPKGWDIYTLRELVVPSCPISYGIVQPGEDIEEGGVPIVRPVDLDDTHWVTAKGLKRTTKEISDAYRRTILDGNELLLCVRGTTGLVGLATEELKGCNVTRGITPLSFNERVDRVFMLCMFLSDGIQEFISDNTIGSALRGINMAVIREMKFPVPPIDIQRSFASLYEQADKSKFDGLKSQFIEQFSGENIPRYELSSLCSEFLDGDWIESKDQSDAGYRLVQTGNVGVGEYIDKSGRARFVSEETFKRLNCTEIVSGDILFSRLPEPLGRCCIIPEDFPKAITAVDCTIARLNEKCLPEFLVVYTATSMYSSQVDKCVTGTTRQRISRNNLAKISVPCPSRDEQIAFVKIIRQADKSKYLS